eukprot:UN04155
MKHKLTRLSTINEEIRKPLLADEAIMNSAFRLSSCCCVKNSYIGLLITYYIMLAVSIFMLFYFSLHPSYLASYHLDIGNTHFFLQVTALMFGIISIAANIYAIYLKRPSLWKKVYYLSSISILIFACLIYCYLVIEIVVKKSVGKVFWNNRIIIAFIIDSLYSFVWIWASIITKRIIQQIYHIENKSFESLSMYMESTESYAYDEEVDNSVF